MLHFHIISSLESQSYLNMILNGIPRASPVVLIRCLAYVGQHPSHTVADSSTAKGGGLLPPG